MDILDITEPVFSEKSIVSKEYHSYEPLVGGEFKYNDERRMTVLDVDTLTLPSESYLYIEGNLLKSDGLKSDKLKFVNNALAFIFREIRYEINGLVIDSVRNVGITSTMKAYLSYNESESNKLKNAGWYPKFNPGKAKAEENIIINKDGNFTVCIPLKMLLGFFEDYQKIIINMKQELVLIRTSDDLDSILTSDPTEIPKITINKILWRMPHIQIGLQEQLAISKLINKNTEIQLPFRSWELIEYPKLATTTRHTWSVKTSTGLESPKYVAIGFQTGKKGSAIQNMSTFNDIKLKNIKVFLNSDRYPYNDLHLNFEQQNFAELYEMFSKFRTAYYGLPNETLLSPDEFLTIAPLTFIDCSFQKNSLETGSVNLRVEFETTENVTDGTSAYCLIIHEKIFTYNPLTKIVRQM